MHRAAARGDIETLVQTVQHDPSVLELQKADGENVSVAIKRSGQGGRSSLVYH